MPDSTVKGYQIITPGGEEVIWERMHHVKNYWACFPNRFLHDSEIDGRLDMMKSFGCQVIVHFNEAPKRKETVVIPSNCHSIECGVMIKQWLPEPQWSRTEYIARSMHGNLWWRDIMKSGGETVFRTHEQLHTEELIAKLERRKKHGEEIRFYDSKGVRIYG